jgi:hypothetical protein
MRTYLQELAAIALVACSPAEDPAPRAPPPPHEGQLAVTFAPAALHSGSNTFYFTVVSYDGSRSPPAIAQPLNRVEVMVRLLNGSTSEEISAPAHFIPNGPEFRLADGTLRRGNYWAQLELPNSGAAVIEFLLAGSGQSRRIQAPLAIAAQAAD